MKHNTTLLFFLTFIYLLWAVQVHAAPPPPLAFAQPPLFTNASVSPSGRYFFARVAQGEKVTFTVYDMEADGAIVAAMEETDKGSVNWARWANDDTIILRLGFLAGRRVTLRVEGEAEKYYTDSFSELFVLPVPTSPEDIGSSLWNLSARGSLVSLLYNDPDHVLIQERGKGARRPEVYKKSVREEGKSERVQKGVPQVHSWAADREGRIRVGYGGRYNYSGLAEYKLLMRAHDEDEFRDLADKYYTSDVDQRFRPLSFAEDIDQLYVASNHETDTLALYLFDIRKEAFVRQIYHNPDFDISSIMIDERTGELLGLFYGADGDEAIWFDEELNREIDKISENFPDKEALLSTYTVEADVGIVAVRSPNFPGQLYLYDRKRKELSPLPPQYADLPEDEMGKVISASYPARDGESIPAFLTLPPGIESLDEARNLPFVIYPHGGPAARSFLTFDTIAQFFATRGYGVLQMNFRGSAGYGLKYERAGRRQWGRLMQDDVTDGVNWLTEEGIADPQKIAVFGASYGGYAALMGAVLTPELYQCAVSFAGVTNLPLLVSGAHKDSYVSRLIGDRFKDNEELYRYSPLHRAADFETPVLLIHGRLDGRVPYNHAKDLNHRLKTEKKTVEFATLPQTGHSLNDYNDRVRFYELLDNYFSTCLPN